MITIADSIEESEKCIAIAEQHREIFCTVGVHPHNAKVWKDEDSHMLTSMIEMHPKICAIGEIGLDYHYDFSPRDVQKHVFAKQLALAISHALPCVIHSREAIADVWTTIDQLKPAKLVLHCCTEKWMDVERFIDRGYFLSFTGIATYPNAEEIRTTIRHCPLEQLMLETDSPYLAPITHRGKRNEPACVVEVAKLVAEVKGMSLDKVDAITTQNAVEFFRLRL